MLENLVSAGQKMAREFVDTNQDIFVMVADVEGQEVTVSVKFAPPAPKMDNRAVWKMFEKRINSNQTLT